MSIPSLSSDLAKIIRNFCPIVCLHPKEQYLPCSVEFFFERSQLAQRLQDGSKRVVIPRGELSLENVTKTTSKASLGDGYFLDLANPAADRVGQSSGHLSTVPVMCHVKRVLTGDNSFLVEINYMFFFAYSGPYVVLGKQKGDHDGDWEHVSVRCDTQGQLIAVYYSAHRHGDGTWVPADRVLFDNDTGRLLAFCALNGHGMYPRPRTNWRVFGLANDVTSAVGRRWCAKKCIVVRPPDVDTARGDEPLTIEHVPSVQDRGAPFSRVPQKTRAARYKLGDPAFGFNDGSVHADQVEVEVQGHAFMQWNLKWGRSSSPQLQRWFKDAEHPKGSSTPRRLCIPCIKT